MTSKEISNLTHFARKRVRRAVQNGLIIKPDVCEECGRARTLEASHDDYTKPLEVRWLCLPCHRMADYTRPKLTSEMVAAINEFKQQRPRRSYQPVGWWTKERIVEAFQRYAEGDIPPRAMLGLTASRPLDFPPTSIVLKVFGSWSKATVAAGFRPRGRGESISR